MEIIIPKHDPIIAPLTVNWQMNKSSQLELTFCKPIEQPTSHSGLHLKDYLPCQFEEINKDGNCLFRCLAKVITGSQEAYPKARGEICRYIATTAKEKLGWCFHTTNETPLKYLLRTQMADGNNICADGNNIWGTEMEILAASAILETDIYVATECDITDDSSPFQMSNRVIHWCRYSASSNYDHSCAIYMANFNSHYEPVIKFIYSIYPTYAEEDQNVITLD